MKKRLLGNILKFIKVNNLIRLSDRVLLAISGGADSVFMAVIFKDIARILNIYFECAHVNHGIRGEEADRDEHFVREFCEKMKVHLTVKKLNGLSSIKSGIEERAREMRYKALLDIANERNLNRIATAHTLDDNIETVLFNLIRGAGVAGISGIRVKNGSIIRPLLSIRRSDIENYLRRENIGYVFDSTNENDIFTRNFIRKKIIPLFLDVNPAFSDHIFRNSMILQDFMTWVRKKVTEIAKRRVFTSLWVDVYDVVRDYPLVVYIELLKTYKKEMVFEEAMQLKYMLNKGRGKMEYRGYDLAIFGNEFTVLKQKEYSLLYELGHSEDMFSEKDFNYRVFFTRKNVGNDSFSCNIGENMLPVILRTRRKGDRVGTKKLKDRFIALKIPYWKRRFWPVFEKDGNIFFVPGVYKKCREGSLKLEVKKYDKGRFSIFD